MQMLNEVLAEHQEIQVIGQKSAVGLIDTEDKTDMLRVNLIDKDSKVDELMISTPCTSARELMKWCKGNKNEFLFAIRGSEGVGNLEKGELQGWVYFYQEDKKRLRELERRGIISLPPKAKIFEISYAKIPWSPKGQVASGIRQALILLPKEWERRNKLGSIFYEIYNKQVLVTAYIDPAKNSESRYVLENCGFIKKGSIKYDETPEREDDVYVLDWDKLYEKLDRATFKELGIRAE